MAKDVTTDPGEGTSIAEVIEHGVVHAVFQPVVDLLSERAIGWEAFARVGDSEAGFDRWMQTAVDAELGTEFQLSALRAIAAHGAPPDDGILFVNVGADLLADQRFRHGVLLRLTTGSSSPGLDQGFTRKVSTSPHLLAITE